MISDSTAQLLNARLNKELEASTLYLYMSAYFNSLTYPGLASHFYEQAQDERTHALKVYNYLIKNRAIIDFGSVTTPAKSWDSPLECAEYYTNFERGITVAYQELADAASQEKDHVTLELATDFLENQLNEEEESYNLFLTIERAGTNVCAMQMIDKSMQA